MVNMLNAIAAFEAQSQAAFWVGLTALSAAMVAHGFFECATLGSIRSGLGVVFLTMTWAGVIMTTIGVAITWQSALAALAAGCLAFVGEIVSRIIVR